MKNKKLNTFCTLLLLLLFNVCESSAQTTGDHPENGKTALVKSQTKEGITVYSFEPLTDYDEFRTNERVERINSMTGDEATVEFRKKKIWIKINPLLTEGDKLERLLKLIVRLHGYSSFVII